MKFSTAIPIHPSEYPIGYDSRLWFMGSCFAANIGNMFRRVKIPATVSPFGTLFNPYSVMHLMKRILTKEYFTREDFFLKDGMYISMELHGDHSYRDADEAVRCVNALLDASYEELKRVTHVFYTFGTPQVYRYKKTGRICANCHKIPQREFSVERMSVDEIYETAMETESLLRSLNPSVRVFYTVSPVRYMGDGILGNSTGKARLFCAVEKILDESDCAGYFPSYELITDELRDYRYYAEDMIHPSSQAVEYVWEKMKETFFSPSTIRVCGDVETIMRNAAHRPQNPQGEQYRLFCEKNLRMIADMETAYPHMDFSVEKEVFSAAGDTSDREKNVMF